MTYGEACAPWYASGVPIPGAVALVSLLRLAATEQYLDRGPRMGIKEDLSQRTETGVKQYVAKIHFRVTLPS